MLRSKWLNVLVAVLIFSVVIIIMTYPLVFRITEVIPGFFSTDEPYAVLWDHWRDKNAVAHAQSLYFVDKIAYPFGVNIVPAKTGMAWNLWQVVNLFLAVVFSVPVSYNLQVLSNFFLCAFIAYMLSYYLTGNRLSAIFCGIIFGFCPYQFMRSWQHLGATYNQWLPLTLLALFVLKEKEGRKAYLFLLISVILLLSFDYYLAYFTFIGIIFLFLYILLYQWKIKLKKGGLRLIKNDAQYLWRVVFIFVLAFILLLPQHFPLIKKWLTPTASVPSAWNTYLRPFEDLFVQSSRPLSFILPAVTHPLFGKFTENFIGSPLYGDSVTEHTLYLGWVPLILAFVAFRNWRKRRQLLGQREDFYIGFFILLALIAWLFAQPPWWKIGPIKIYMPSFFMYKALPMFRAYCRFGIVLMLAIAVLAGFGLKHILERFKSYKIKLVITAMACVLVIFEFCSWPPYKVIDVSKFPAVYDWLKSQPGDFVIGEYPLDAVSPNEMYKFYQTRHEKKIINGTIPGSFANSFAKKIIVLSEQKTAAILKSMGVEYVLVHRDGYLKTDLIKDKEEYRKIRKNSCLQFISSFAPEECANMNIMCVRKSGPVDVYKVLLQPVGRSLKQ